MLILGQRNDDSLAKDVDWFGSSERVEISPASIWVPDEDETIRQRRVTAHQPPVIEENFDYYWSLHEITPQVSVSDEDSFAEPRTLPEINPHVSVRDEDSFAKPSPLPEINPHVSVRDEDSFAKPSPLPEIDPHVSVRDEDSFAKPCPLPEINPHVSLRDEDSFTSGVCGIDDTKVQPGEPSFVSVTTDGQNEKMFIQEYLGLGPSHPTELESSHLTEPESNYPAEMESGRPIVMESSPPVASARVRVLDESQVLPGEASFATAIPSGPSAPSSHSPLQEFLAKTSLDLRTLMLASLLFVSILAVSALVIMEATTGVFSSKFLPSAAAGGTSPQVDSATPQSQPIQTSRPVPPIAMSKLSKQESQTMAPPRETSNREGAKNATSAKSVHAKTKDTADRKKASESVSRHSVSSQKRTTVNKSHSKSTERKPASAAAKNATITKPKAEIKVPSASTGAQRPRRVTQASGRGQ